MWEGEEEDGQEGGRRGRGWNRFVDGCCVLLIQQERERERDGGVVVVSLSQCLCMGLN